MRSSSQNTRLSFNALKKEEGAEAPNEKFKEKPNKKAEELRLLKEAVNKEKQEERQIRVNAVRQEINETVTRPMQDVLSQLVRLDKKKKELFKVMSAFSGSGRTEVERSYNHVRSEIDTLERSWGDLIGKSMYLGMQLRG